MVGLVPTIQPSAGFGACWMLDPRDEPDDDKLGIKSLSCAASLGGRIPVPRFALEPSL